MKLRFHMGLKMPLPNLRVRRFWTTSLARKWSMRYLWHGSTAQLAHDSMKTTTVQFMIMIIIMWISLELCNTIAGMLSQYISSSVSDADSERDSSSYDALLLPNGFWCLRDKNSWNKWWWVTFSITALDQLQTHGYNKKTKIITKIVIAAIMLVIEKMMIVIVIITSITKALMFCAKKLHPLEARADALMLAADTAKTVGGRAK